MPEPIFIKLGMYIMAPEPVSTTCFKNPSHQSFFVCISLLDNGSVKRYRGREYPHSKGIFGGVVSYAVLVVSNESKRLVLPRIFCIIYFNTGD
jgi:hypothetical protein